MSFSHLSTVGTLRYNGYTFDGSAEIQVNVAFLRDDAQRTVICHEHSIEAHFFVNNSAVASTDPDLETIRTLLGEQGRALTFVNKGFGDDLIVNQPDGGGVRDVRWGPKPEILHWQPVGSSSTCEVIWKVTTCVPVCDQVRYTGVMAMNYGVSIGIERGLSIRTVSGYLEIAQTRFGRNVPDSADNYRHLIQPDVPLGFERTSSWTFSADKSRVEFSIVDRQIPSNNPYPQLATKIDARHRSLWHRGRNGTAHRRNNISVDIELPLRTSPALAWQIFGQIVKSRVDYAKLQKRSAFLDEVFSEENIFGLSSSFSCSYRVLVDVGAALNGAAIQSELFDPAKDGLWQPIGTDWRLWRTSMAQVFDNRGLARLAVPAQNDVIVDLCGAGTTIPWFASQPPTNYQRPPLTALVTNQKPPPQTSFIDYQQTIIPERESPTVRQSPLQPSEGGDQTSGNQQDPLGFQFGGPGGTSDTIQDSGRKRYTVTLIGRATRAGYEIPRPVLRSVGGQTAHEVSGKFLCQSMGSFLGVTVFRAAWVIRYMLGNAPGPVPAPPNLEN